MRNEQQGLLAQGYSNPGRLLQSSTGKGCRHRTDCYPLDAQLSLKFVASGGQVGVDDFLSWGCGVWLQLGEWVECSQAGLPLGLWVAEQHLPQVGLPDLQPEFALRPQGSACLEDCRPLEHRQWLDSQAEPVRGPASAELELQLWGWPLLCH